MSHYRSGDWSPDTDKVKHDVKVIQCHRITHIVRQDKLNNRGSLRISYGFFTEIPTTIVIYGLRFPLGWILIQAVVNNV